MARRLCDDDDLHEYNMYYVKFDYTLSFLK